MSVSRIFRRTRSRLGAWQRERLKPLCLAAALLPSLYLVAHADDGEASKADYAAIDLDRLDGQIVVPMDDGMRSLNDFSFDMVVRYGGPREGHIFSFHREWNIDGFYFKVRDDDRLELAFGEGNGISYVLSPKAPLEAGQWYRLSGIKDGPFARLFIDGREVASAKVVGDILDSEGDIRIGRSGDYSAAMQIAHFRFWRDVLDPDQIAALGAGDDRGAEPAPLIDLDFAGGGDRIENQAGPDYQGRIESQNDGLANDEVLGWVEVASTEGPSADRSPNGDIDPPSKREASSTHVQPRLKPLDVPDLVVVPEAKDETARRRSARSDLFDIAQGQSRIMTLSSAADTVIVDDANIAKAEILSPRRIYLLGASAGRTGIRALDREGEIIEEVMIRVGAALEAADQELSAIEGGDDNRFVDRGGRPVLQGPADDVAEAMELAAIAGSPAIGDVPARNDTTIDDAQQVNIKVRFAEVSRSDLDLLGINWSAVINGGVVDDAIAGQFFLADSLVDAAGSAIGRIEAGDVNIDFLFEALQQEGALSMLAEPNLTVLNGEEASFLAGGELPIPVPQESGGATTVEFKPFGVSLDFRPVILGDNRISLQVASEVSDISAEGAVQLGSLFVPAISVRRAETSLELSSGQTFAVGGLFNRTISRDIAKIPGLGSIPILGALFRSTRYQRSETELVILITPYLVRPVDDPGELAFPGQGDDASKSKQEEARTGTGFIVR